MARIFFRIIASNRPTVDDFMSNFAKGRPPRHSEILDPALHRGLSVYAEIEDARSVQRLFPKLGSHLAELELTDDDAEIAMQKVPDDPADSHHTLRGTPEAFLSRVRRTFPA